MPKKFKVLAGLILASAVFGACKGVDTTTPDVTPTQSEEVDLSPIWTEMDGEKTFFCPAANGYQEALITLPPSSPFTEELNNLLNTYDGRSPLTVLSVRQTEPTFSFDDPSRIDETTFLSTVTITSPEGVLELERFSENVNVPMLLFENKLTGWTQQTERPELSKWAQDLASRTEYEYDYEEWVEVEGETRISNTLYFATEHFPTQIDSIELTWGSYQGYAECRAL